MAATPKRKRKHTHIKKQERGGRRGEREEGQRIVGRELIERSGERERKEREEEREIYYVAFA